MAIPREGCVWNDLRCDEFEKFEQLLKECSYIDCSTGVLDRLKKIIELARELNDRGRLDAQPSFRMFLHDLCLDDRFPGWRDAPLEMAETS